MNMQPSELAEHFAAWHDEDLIRALKMQRTDYETSYLESIAAELSRRGVDPAAFIDQLKISYNGEEPSSCNTVFALAKLTDDFPLWHALSFTHYFGSTLVVQRELDTWLVNAYVEDVYGFSFFVADRPALLELLQLFLKIEDWEHFIGERHNLDRWKPLLRTRSARYIQKVAAALAEEELVCTVQTPVFTRDQRGQLALLVSVPKEAEPILHKLQDRLLDLYAQADEAFAQNASTRELGVYTELVDYGLNNPAVYYNLGSALGESGRHTEAAVALIEAASLSLTELDTQVQFQARKGPGGLSGLFDMVSMLFSTFKPGEPNPSDALREIPDYIEDIELQLIRLIGHLPQNLQILHSLASIAAIRHDVPLALERYRQILTLAPDDETAQLYFDEQEAE